MMLSAGRLALLLAIGQASQYVAQPVLARLYTAQQFGEWASISTVASLMAVFISLQSGILITSCRSRLRRRNILFWSSIQVPLMAILVACLAAFYSSLSGNVPIFMGSLTVVCLYAILIAWGTNFRAWISSASSYGHLGASIAVRGISGPSLQCYIGSTSFQPGLLTGAVAGELLGCAYSLAVVIRDFAYLTSYVLRRIWGLGVSYLSGMSSMLVLVAQELSAIAFLLLPLWIATEVVGVEYGGRYYLAHKLAWAGPVLAAQAFGPIINNHVLFGRRSLGISYVFSIYVSAATWIGGSIVIWFLSKDAFLLLTGEAWLDAGDIFMWTCLWSWSFLVALPYRVALRANSQFSVQLFCDIAAVGLTLFCSVWYAKNIGIMLHVTTALIGVAQNMVIVIAAVYFVPKISRLRSNLYV
jgi:hypothetical protein